MTSSPVEAVHHLQLSSEVLLGEVVQHAGVHQGLHEVWAVLRQTQAGQPLVTNPLVVHVSIRQSLQGEEEGAPSEGDMVNCLDDGVTQDTTYDKELEKSPFKVEKSFEKNPIKG